MIQIVPALPPSINGVGDYALAVARVMRSEFGLDTAFVVGNPAWQGADEVEGFRVRKVAARTAQGLEAALLEAARSAAGDSRVLLQLSGYGYSGRGCPWWLMQGLRRWRAKRTDARLVTMFHELYAQAPPWRKTFWVSPAQRMVVKGIARSSDVAVTNIQIYRGRLERVDPSKQGSVEALAVPSNVGEPLEPGELGRRAKSMAVFGLPGSRMRSYATRMAALQRACEALGIAEIHDIGGSFAGIPERVGGVPVRQHGEMGASELSLLLSGTMAGFVDYYPGYFGQIGSVCGVLRAPDDSGDAGRWAIGSGRHRVRGSLLRRGGKRRHDARAGECTVDCRRGMGVVSGALADESRAGVCGDCWGTERAGMTLAYLWRERRRHPVGSRAWMKSWAKRMWNAPALFRLVWLQSRLRAGGAQVGTLTVVSARVLGPLKNFCIGDQSSVSEAMIVTHAPVTIGNRVTINDGVTILTASHDLTDPGWKTYRKPVRIDDYAWVAQGSMIMPGVHIGRGAVVGAGRRGGQGRGGLHGGGRESGAAYVADAGAGAGVQPGGVSGGIRGVAGETDAAAGLGKGNLKLWCCFHIRRATRIRARRC